MGDMAMKICMYVCNEVTPKVCVHTTHYISMQTEPACFFPTPKYVVSSSAKTDHGIKVRG